MKILFVSSGNKSSNSTISTAQAESIMEYDRSVTIEFYQVVGKGLVGYIKNIRKLRNKIKSIKPDLIHSHYSFCGLLSSLTFTKTPKVVSLMGSDVQKTGFWKITIYIFCKLWDVVIVKSNGMKEKVGIKKLIVIPNGVSFNKFLPIEKLEAVKKLNLNINKKYVLFLADPERKEKNYLLAKASVEMLNNSMVELLTISKINHNQTRFYYYASDVVILTSLYEGSPNVIKEAMACNKPIVSTDVGDVNLLLNNLDGCFISDFNVKSVASNLEKALLFKGETKGKLQLVRLGLDSESIAKKIIYIYRTNLSKTY